MDGKQFERILLKYNNPRQRIGIPDHVRQDIKLLIEHANGQHRMANKLGAELRGAMQTMLAITKAVGGIVEVPFALIDSLKDADSLLVSDSKAPTGEMYKRFSFKAAPEPAEKPTIELIDLPPAPGIQ